MGRRVFHTRELKRGPERLCTDSEKHYFGYVTLIMHGPKSLNVVRDEVRKQKYLFFLESIH